MSVPRLTVHSASQPCLQPRDDSIAVHVYDESLPDKLILDDRVESCHWLWILANLASEAGKGAGGSTVGEGARVRCNARARKDAEQEKVWVISAVCDLIAWKLCCSSSLQPK